MRRPHSTVVVALVVALLASSAAPAIAQEIPGGPTGIPGQPGIRLEERDVDITSRSRADERNDASTDEYPRRGVQTGGGSTATGGTSDLPLVLSGGAFALLMATGGVITVRRRLGR